MVRVGSDIGGTLIKTIVQYNDQESIILEPYTRHFSPKIIYKENKHYAFFICHRSDLESFLTLLTQINTNVHLEHFGVTGGGAFCFQEQFTKNKLTPKLQPEFESLRKGLVSWDNNFPNSFYSFSGDQKIRQQIISLKPFLLVNIGSGCSMNIFTESSELVHVAGTSFGGTTLMGFANKLFGIQHFDEILNLFTEFANSHPNFMQNNVLPASDYLIDTFRENTINELDLKQQMITTMVMSFIENICSIAYFNAKSKKVSQILFLGYSISEADIFHSMFDFKIKEYSKYNLFEVQVI